ncbi:MAG: MarC family protein [Nitrososphaerota archaeon]|nr:MarC family protein [Nitrososphaerota archaeon]
MPGLAAFFAFDIALFLEAFVLLFAVIDAVGTVPIFIGLTEGVAGSRKTIVEHAVLISTAILVLFALFGWLIFDIFGININDFRVGGGIILFIVAVDHLRGEEDRTRGLAPSDIAAFPLATPLLAGPGAISTVIIISSPPYSPFLALLVVGCNAVVAYLVLSSSEWVRKFIGQNGTVALSRITALLIAALAVSFVAEGLKGLFPLL